VHFFEEDIDFANIQFKHLCLECKIVWKENSNFEAILKAPPKQKFDDFLVEMLANW